MNLTQLLKKVRQIELTSLQKANASFLGEYHSSYKGTGVTFSEVRPYQYGDDIRKIDWNKTAQYNETFIKTFEEERELSLVLLIDVTASMHFGTLLQTKRETLAEIAATLGFSALKNNDKVGVIFFSNKIEMFVPPKKGRAHMLRIIREMIDFEPIATQTNLDLALKFLLKTIKRKSIVFILSDFDSENYQKSLNIVAKKHDLAGIRLYDRLEKELPNIGFVKMNDLETGKTKWINTSSKKVREKYNAYYSAFTENLISNFKLSGANIIQLQPQEDYIKALISHFQKHKRI